MQNYEDCLLSTTTFDIEQDFAVWEQWTMKRFIQPSMDYHRKLKLET